MSLTALLQQAGLLGNPNLEMSPPYTAAMEPSVPNYGGSIDTSGYDAANRNLVDLLANPPAMSPMPERTSPAFRTSDAVVGGGGLLLSLLLGGGREAAGFAQNYLGAKGQRADRETQRSMQNWQIQNQQSQAAHQGKLNAAKYGAEVAEGSINRQYRDKERDEDKAFRDKQLEATQKGLNYRAELKDNAKAADQQIKAMSLRYGISREAALDALYDQDRISDELYMKLRPSIGKPTAGEGKETAQTKAIADKNKRDQEIHTKKLLDFDKKWKVWESQGKVRDAQIKKWQNDARVAQGNLNARNREHEWRKKNPFGVSFIDRQIFQEQLNIAEKEAELQQWMDDPAQTADAGFFKAESEAKTKAAGEIQRSIAGSRARIQQLQSLGGSDAVAQKRQAAQQAIDELTRGGAPESDKAKIRQYFKRDTGFDL